MRLTVELQLHPQHAVRRRVLGAEADLHLLDVEQGYVLVRLMFCPLLVRAAHRSTAGRVDVRVDGGAGVDAFDRKVLAQRVAVEALPDEDALEPGWPSNTTPNMS